MSEKNNPQMKEYVSEKWWHRLLKVVIYISTIIVLFLSAAILYDSFKVVSYTYSYSFEEGYDKFKGKEYDCKTYSYLKYISCGKGTISASDFNQLFLLSLQIELKRYKGKNQKKYKLVKKIIALYKKKKQLMESDHKFSEYIIINKKVKRKEQRHINYKNSISLVGVSLAIGAGWFIASMILYKLILYIAHGHTRVRKQVNKG